MKSHLSRAAEDAIVLLKKNQYTVAHIAEKTGLDKSSVYALKRKLTGKTRVYNKKTRP